VLSYPTTCFLLAWCLVPVGVAQADKEDNIIYQKNDLDRIQKEVKESRTNLDSLKQGELLVQKRISEYDQKILSNKKIVSRLNKQLNQLKKGIADADNQLERSRLHLDRTRRRFLGNIRQFYLAARKSPEVFTESPNKESELNRQIVYLTALADFESGNVVQSSTYLTQSLEQLSRLTGEKKKVSRLKKKKETATALEKSQKSQQQKELEHLRRTKSEEADRMLTLQQAAREIERIITRLERERQESISADQGQPLGPSAFAALKGQLALPFKGKIVVGFGTSMDPITKLKSYSPGITIKGKTGQEVVAVADGTIAYGGNLRGYGKFIIINHDDQYYSTYGGLEETLVEANEYVLGGTKLGLAGQDGLVKFELRRGSKPLDPVKWIRIDSF